VLRMSHLQKSEWMSCNPTSSAFVRWNEGHGGSIRRQKGRRPFGRTSGRPQGEGQRLESNSSLEIRRSGEGNRRSRLLQVARMSVLLLLQCNLSARFSYCKADVMLRHR